MLWVWILIGIAVAGVLVAVGYARWLWHKASDVMAEVNVVADRLGQLGDLLGRLDLGPLAGAVSAPPQRERVVFDEDEYAEDDRIAAAEAAAGTARHVGSPSTP